MRCLCHPWQPCVYGANGAYKIIVGRLGWELEKFVVEMWVVYTHGTCLSKLKAQLISKMNEHTIASFSAAKKYGKQAAFWQHPSKRVFVFFFLINFFLAVYLNFFRCLLVYFNLIYFFCISWVYYSVVQKGQTRQMQRWKWENLFANLLLPLFKHFIEIEWRCVDGTHEWGE